MLVFCILWLMGKVLFTIQDSGRWGKWSILRNFHFNKNIKGRQNRRTGYCTWSKPWDARLQRFKIKCKSYGFSKVLVIFTLTHKVLRRKGTTNYININAAGKCIFICRFLSIIISACGSSWKRQTRYKKRFLICFQLWLKTTSHLVSIESNTVRKSQTRPNWSSSIVKAPWCLHAVQSTAPQTWMPTGLSAAWAPLLSSAGRPKSTLKHKNGIFNRYETSFRKTTFSIFCAWCSRFRVQ